MFCCVVWCVICQAKSLRAVCQHYKFRFINTSVVFSMRCSSGERQRKENRRYLKSIKLIVFLIFRHREVHWQPGESDEQWSKFSARCCKYILWPISAHNRQRYFTFDIWPLTLTFDFATATIDFALRLNYNSHLLFESWLCPLIFTLFRSKLQAAINRHTGRGNVLLGSIVDNWTWYKGEGSI